jgi:rare lipoprotein A
MLGKNATRSVNSSLHRGIFRDALCRSARIPGLATGLVIGLTLGLGLIVAPDAADASQRRGAGKTGAASAVSSRSFSGLASYYGSESGSKTASGARYNPSALTAAHRTLPFGTQVKVTEPRSGRSVVVLINDRGPFVRGRVLDLSVAAARAIGITGRGVGHVVAEVL